METNTLSLFSDKSTFSFNIQKKTPQSKQKQNKSPYCKIPEKGDYLLKISNPFLKNGNPYVLLNHSRITPNIISVFKSYIFEILPIWRRTLSHQTININKWLSINETMNNQRSDKSKMNL